MIIKLINFISIALIVFGLSLVLIPAFAIVIGVTIDFISSFFGG
jgi:hypothetical protein